MVIVIGVIILLAALTLSVSVAVVEGSEVRQTENTIRLLTAAIQEWEAQADRRVTYGIEMTSPTTEMCMRSSSQTRPIPIRCSRMHASPPGSCFQIIGRPASVKQILAQVDLEAVAQEEDEDGSRDRVPQVLSMPGVSRSSPCFRAGSGCMTRLGTTGGGTANPTTTARFARFSNRRAVRPPTARSASSPPDPMGSSAI